jgi:phosphoribosylglycinamide formyltransferase 1
VSVRLAVLASGGGSNLQAILDHFHRNATGVARVALVISDRAGAGALDRAAAAGVQARVIGVADRPEARIAEEMLEALAESDIELIALAGYLRRIPESVVHAYRGRILNIHPALLPAFGGKGMYGLHVHRAVIASGATVSGATVHLVDEEYDRGRILVQWPVPVLPGDAAEGLAARVLAVEHRLYPAAIEWAARRMQGEHVRAATGAPARPAHSEAHFALAAAGPPGTGAIQSIMRDGED